MPTGLSPEFVYFDDEADFEAGVSHYLLRPEAVESFFILNYLTGDPGQCFILMSFVLVDLK